MMFLSSTVFILGCAGFCGSCGDEDGDGFSLRDCDDADPAIHPDAAELCDGIDNNCDDAIDEGVLLTFYMDADGDGFGGTDTEDQACGLPEGSLEQGGDCDDGDDGIHPDAVEDCTEDLDRDCDGSTDYADTDADGHAACVDCDDSDSDRYPGADERCNELDDDCDDTVDEDPIDPSTWYADEDGDGYGTSSDTLEACDAPAGYLADSQDCDDADGAIHPGADEVCNGMDDDCSSTIAEALVPSDYASVQAALDADEPWICVEAGRHEGAIDFGGRDAVVESTEGAEQTAIVGSAGFAVVTFESAEGPDSILRGLTLEGGKRGILIDGASPTLEALVIRDNTLRDEEGAVGILALDSAFTLTDSVIRDNTGDDVSRGPLLIEDGSDVLLDRVTIQDNHSESYAMLGGALGCFDSSLTVANLAIVGNSIASEYAIQGAAMFVDTCMIQGDNLLIAGNTCTRADPSPGNFTALGAFVTNNSELDLSNVSIVGNTSTEDFSGPGIYTQGGSILILSNLDISGNGAAPGSGAQADNGGAIMCNNQDVQVRYANYYDNDVGLSYVCDDIEVGELSTDPGYVDTTGADPSAWDLTLATGSDLIDAGDPSISDPDGSRSDVGAHGGPGGDHW